MTQVTLDWILSELREKCQGQGWGGDIIRNANDYCPLCALASIRGENPRDDRQIYFTTKLPEMRQGLDDSHPYAQIVDAADFPAHPLRPQLMEALGM